MSSFHPKEANLAMTFLFGHSQKNPAYQLKCVIFPHRKRIRGMRILDKRGIFIRDYSQVQTCGHFEQLY